MDPAPSRLAAILTIEQLFEEAGVRTPLREGVLGALGDPTTVREVAFVSDEDWQGLAATLLFSPGTEQGVEGPSTAPVALTPVQKSRVRYLQRVARLVAGLPVERERPLPVWSFNPPTHNHLVGLVLKSLTSQSCGYFKRPSPYNSVALAVQLSPRDRSGQRKGGRAG